MEGCVHSKELGRREGGREGVEHLLGPLAPLHLWAALGSDILLGSPVASPCGDLDDQSS